MTTVESEWQNAISAHGVAVKSSYLGSLPVVHRFSTRRYVALHPVYDMLEDDVRFFLGHDKPTFRHRPVSVRERHEARAEDREEPDFVLVVEVQVDKNTTAMLRIGWLNPWPPTAVELAAVEFEPGVKLDAIVRGAAHHIRRMRKRRWRP